jgi:hypothetical protein
MGILFGDFSEERSNQGLSLFFNVEAEAVVRLDNSADGVVQHGVASVRAAGAALDAVYEDGSTAIGFDV